MIFLRKAHLIMRQSFHMIGCNASKKGAFSALKMITAAEMPSIPKKTIYMYFEKISVCVLNKERLCILKKSSKICHFS